MGYMEWIMESRVKTLQVPARNHSKAAEHLMGLDKLKGKYFIHEEKVSAVMKGNMMHLPTPGIAIYKPSSKAFKQANFYFIISLVLNIEGYNNSTSFGERQRKIFHVEDFLEFVVSKLRRSAASVRLASVLKLLAS